jgi:hypothetical protein
MFSFAYACGLKAIYKTLYLVFSQHFCSVHLGSLYFGVQVRSRGIRVGFRGENKKFGAN